VKEQEEEAKAEATKAEAAVEEEALAEATKEGIDNQVLPTRHHMK
jgi:hypothetical protein